MKKVSTSYQLTTVWGEDKMMQYTIFILISALFCKVLSLSCYQCIPETSVKCTDKQVECPLGQCGNMITTAYVGSTILVDMVMKNCSLTQQCVTASVNFGVTKTIISNQCCNTNLCNAQRQPDVMRNIPNGLQCYTCNGEDCSSTLDCVDDEDHCIKSTVDTDGQTMMMRGCATRSFCMGDLSVQLGQTNTVTGLTCCEGNLCNHGRGVTLRLVLMLLPFSITLL